MAWITRGTQFLDRLEQLCALRDSFISSGSNVSVLGTSAGGSAAINLFAADTDKIHKVATVCARLRRGSATGSRSFINSSLTSPAFARSVVMCEENITNESNDAMSYSYVSQSKVLE